MASAEEVLELMTDTVEPTRDVFEIDPASRAIIISTSGILFGVESDCKSERKYFRCPKMVSDSIDLSTSSLRINFKNANNETDQYIVDDVMENGAFVTFSWLLSKKVTRFKGNISFIVCAVRTHPDGTIINEWNTTLAQGKVLGGLEVIEPSLEPPEQDTISQLLLKIEDAEYPRVIAETNRETAETGRVDAEKVRTLAETTRASEFAILKTESQTATTAANTAAQKAESYVLGDISDKTVTFTQAGSDMDITSGDETGTLFGKILKRFNILKSNISTITTNIGTLANLLTADKSNLVAAVNELNKELGNHIHDDRYYTETEINNRLSCKRTSMTYAISNVKELGSPYAIKIGGLNFTHLSFKVLNTVPKGTVLLTSPYRPSENETNYGYVTSKGSAYVFAIYVDGTVVCQSQLEAGEDINLDLIAY